MTRRSTSYRSGFARTHRFMYPKLRRGLRGLWAPYLGVNGLKLRDESGWRNHGTLTNMAPATDWVPSPYGPALQFTKADAANHVAVSNPTATCVTTDQMSCVALFDPGTITSSSSDEDTIIYTPQLILRLASDDDLETFFYDDTATVRNLDADNIWTSNEWQTLGWTFDNNTVRVYRNGVQAVSSGAFAGNGIGAAAVATPAIGANYAGAGGDFFNGRIAWLGTWDRALSPNEIRQLSTDPHALTRQTRFVPTVVGAAPAPTGPNLLTLLGVG